MLNAEKIPGSDFSQSVGGKWVLRSLAIPASSRHVYERKLAGHLVFNLKLPTRLVVLEFARGPPLPPERQHRNVAVRKITAHCRTRTIK